MTNFIETQKELAREEMRGMYYDDSDEFPRLLDTLITQVIQNTLEEVARGAEPDNTVSLIAQAIREERRKVLEEVGRVVQTQRDEQENLHSENENCHPTDCEHRAVDFALGELQSLLAEMVHPPQEQGENVNTPDTEWEKECYFDLIEAITDVWHKQCGERAAFPLTDMREAIQPIIQKALSSRDTYWKERVRKEVEDALRRLDIDDHNYLTARREIAKVSGIPMMAITFNEHLKVIKEKLEATPITNNR